MGSGSDDTQGKGDEGTKADEAAQEAASDSDTTAPSAAVAESGSDEAKPEKEAAKDVAKTEGEVPAPARDPEPSSGDEDEAKAPIVDPLSKTGELNEAERIIVENLSVRAGWLSIASFVAGGLGCVIALTSLSGRVDFGVVVTVLPLGLANIALGVVLRRTAAKIEDIAKDKLRSKKPLLVAVSELQTVFMIQLLAAFYLALLQVLSLTFMLIMRHSAEI
jgi:hypothetical protein